uniref:WAP domain-containing protein n=1 Tax=Pinctada fucata TaxID=50426 RepID=A0A194AKU7_PINFU
MKTFIVLAVVVAVVGAEASRLSSLLTSSKVQHAGYCPQPSGLFGICLWDPKVNCLSDDECTQSQKCCQEGCGRVCKASLATPDLFVVSK